MQFSYLFKGLWWFVLNEINMFDEYHFCIVSWVSFLMTFLTPINATPLSFCSEGGVTMQNFMVVFFTTSNSGQYKGGLNKPPAPISQYKEGQCSCCRQAHTLPTCPKFKTLTPQIQSAIVRRDRICFHCLGGVHLTRECTTDVGKLCGIGGCEKYHHKILHRHTTFTAEP